MQVEIGFREMDGLRVGGRVRAGCAMDVGRTGKADV